MLYSSSLTDSVLCITVDIYPFMRIQHFYMPHFLYHTPFIYCRHSCQGNLGLSILPKDTWEGGLEELMIEPPTLRLITANFDFFY